MGKYKIVFLDGDQEKIIYGYIDISDSELIRIKSDQGNTVFVNKKNVVFLKELQGGKPWPVIVIYQKEPGNST